MEFLNLLIKPQKCFCLLCFKENNETSSCYIDFEIEGNYFSANLNVSDMIKYLFPSFELINTQICTKCMDVIIEMYVIMRRNKCIKGIINKIIYSINNKLKFDKSSSNPKKININLSKILKMNKENSINLKDDSFTELEHKSEENTQETLEENLLIQCSNCFKTFDNNKSYKMHIKSHKHKRKAKYYYCNNCTYKSLCKTSVEGHINKKHLNVRPHVCTVCYKSYFHKKNLLVHIESHQQVRNDICDICGEQFLHKKNLIEHLKLHSGDRPYECELCSKKFVTSGRRLEHIKRIHMEKTENCLLCEKRFSLKKELTRHMKTVHCSL